MILMSDVFFNDVGDAYGDVNDENLLNFTYLINSFWDLFINTILLIILLNTKYKNNTVQTEISRVALKLLNITYDLLYSHESMIVWYFIKVKLK